MKGTVCPCLHQRRFECHGNTVSCIGQQYWHQRRLRRRCWQLHHGQQSLCHPLVALKAPPGPSVVSFEQCLSSIHVCLMCMQIGDFDLGDSLSTALNLNVTVGAASAPLVAAPGMNSTVVTVRSAESIADIVKYNITACMVEPLTYLSS